MINDARIDFQLTGKADLEATGNELIPKNDHYKKLISTISDLNQRSEKFSIVIQVINSPFLTDNNQFVKQLASLIGSLTKREMEVYDLAIKGLSNKSIAEKLFITVETEKHCKKGRRKQNRGY